VAWAAGSGGARALALLPPLIVIQLGTRRRKGTSTAEHLKIVLSVRFRGYWRWKSRPRGGRRKTPTDIRNLIHEMSTANPLWGAPRIHGELLKLGIDVGRTTVAKYMARRRRPPSQGWKTFLRNYAAFPALQFSEPQAPREPSDRAQQTQGGQCCQGRPASALRAAEC
jgi:hypothetical protein